MSVTAGLTPASHRPLMAALLPELTAQEGEATFSGPCFGGRRNSPPEGLNLGTDHLFTGQVWDDSIGLYWYGSRAYDPIIGRFCCPDSIVPSPGDPQSLNRYSYVRNNPLGRVDPTGRYDLRTQSGRADWRRDHPGWVLGDDNHTGHLSALDPGGHTYDVGVRLTYRSSSGHDQGSVIVSASFQDSRILAHTDSQEWDYITYGGVLVRNNIDNTGGWGPVTNPRDFVVNTLGGGDPNNTVTFAPDEIWSGRKDVLMDSALLAHELGHIAQQHVLGWGAYIEAYGFAAAIGTARSPGNPHNALPLEVDANRRAGLPEDWSGQPPADAQDSFTDPSTGATTWTFRVPDWVEQLPPPNVEFG